MQRPSDRILLESRILGVLCWVTHHGAIHPAANLASSSQPGQLTAVANTWTACAFGRDEAACRRSAALLGGQAARVGFENTLPMATLAPTTRCAAGR